MLNVLVVEDNERLRPALADGLEHTGSVCIVGSCGSGEEALAQCLAGARERPAGVVCPPNGGRMTEPGSGPRAEGEARRSGPQAGAPDVVLMDVHLDGAMNGIEAAVAIRREFPRMPVVFYSIQDDDAYYRAFRRSGILSHYGYVRKSNYLLPQMIVPLLQDAVAGRSFIDPEIESRVQEVRQKDEESPMALLEPNEQEVAKLLAQGMSNEHIAARLGFRDKRTISRTNGQIYTAWGLNESTTDEKVARTRAIIIMREGRLIRWGDDGTPHVLDGRGRWTPYELVSISSSGSTFRLS